MTGRASAVNVSDLSFRQQPRTLRKGAKMTSPSEPDTRDLTRVEKALQDLILQVGVLTTAFAVQAKSLIDIERILQANGGLTKEVTGLRFDVNHLIKDVEAMKFGANLKDEKLSDRIFEIVKIAIPWIFTAAIGWLATRLK